jgi:hypothetical protein
MYMGFNTCNLNPQQFVGEEILLSSRIIVYTFVFFSAFSHVKQFNDDQWFLLKL